MAVVACRNRFVAGMTTIAAAAFLVLAIGATIAAFAFRARRNQIPPGRSQDAREPVHCSQGTGTSDPPEPPGGPAFREPRRPRAGRYDRADLGLPLERVESLRDEAIACLALPDMRQVGRVIHRPLDVFSVAFDPTMTRYAFRFRDGTILVRAGRRRCGSRPFPGSGRSGHLRLCVQSRWPLPGINTLARSGRVGLGRR